MGWWKSPSFFNPQIVGWCFFLSFFQASWPCKIPSNMYPPPPWKILWPPLRTFSRKAILQRHCPKPSGGLVGYKACWKQKMLRHQKKSLGFENDESINARWKKVAEIYMNSFCKGLRCFSFVFKNVNHHCTGKMLLCFSFEIMKLIPQFALIFWGWFARLHSGSLPGGLVTKWRGFRSVVFLGKGGCVEKNKKHWWKGLAIQKCSIFAVVWSHILVVLIMFQFGG